MHSRSIWRAARRPNYATNTNKIYPYSEVPFLGEYYLVRLPLGEDLIELVDYWGEGRIETKQGSSGFRDSYCVNHQYQLVSNGPDTDRKIPNRIPVISYVDCDTSGYIKDNSVKVVTLMGAPINRSCAQDIARMVNTDRGKVIVYGFSETAADIKNLEAELSNKGLIHCYGYSEDALFKEPTLFDSFRAYLNAKDIAAELYKSVTGAEYEKAVKISKTLDNGLGSVVADVVEKLLKDGVKNTMDFAYQLWNEEADNIVKNYFPVTFRLVLNEDKIKLINKKTLETLKLDGDAQWKITPVWETDKVVFKIMDVGRKMYLGLDTKSDANGERQAFGFKTDSEDKVNRWMLEPMKIDDDVFFNIVNVEYNQRMKVEEDLSRAGGNNKLLAPTYGEKGVSAAFGWFIAPWE